ncbi:MULTISPECIES: hypothetical protein [unclassified Spirosoma]|uniref:glycine-rich domain-containing protein n=1 Tax=unclassified Spirosoma TaxID=2621999 RepID=UPI00095AC862|nr:MULTISPECIES: hypothetical protein [unclassified Spirosoma]MBN8821830.1 hypothetical protein [Spirosoma sp.]OJW80681.1 MAG: hypothetical protein BGO59_35040 [Spirosoma sp. 48-14]
MRLYFLLWLFVTGDLLAQTPSPPVITLSANTFYQGEPPGSYTITCPSGTSVGISNLTKIASVPLPSPSATQPPDGTIFTTARTLSGTVVTGNLPPATSNAFSYTAGVFTGSGLCYGSSPFSLATSTSFILTLTGLTRAEDQARTAWALKANSVKLPQLSTSEQNKLPPQQAGNLVFNTDQQRMAIHTGSNWQYVNTYSTGTSQFQNSQVFTTSTTWIVPTNVTLIMAEVWGAGAGGTWAQTNGITLSASGGGAGGYGRGYMQVTPGTALTLIVGAKGNGGSWTTPTSNGGNSQINSATGAIGAYGGSTNQQGGFAFGSNLGFGCQGGNGSNAKMSYGQKSATDYIFIVQCGDGGTAYGMQPGGYGSQYSLTNSTSLLFSVNGGRGQTGSFPGGGGGGGDLSGGDGAAGMIIVYW